MAKREEVGKLLSNMKASAEPKAAAKKSPRGEAQHSHQEVSGDPLHRDIDISAYKEQQGWPGHNYFLVGNSYNAGRKKNDAAYNKRRAAAIAYVLEPGRQGSKQAPKNALKNAIKSECVSVQEALSDDAFVKALSRFEYDWLKRESHALLGPAFDHQSGKRIPGSFAVWQVINQNQGAKASTKSRQLVGAK